MARYRFGDIDAPALIGTGTPSAPVPIVWECMHCHGTYEDPGEGGYFTHDCATGEFTPATPEEVAAMRRPRPQPRRPWYVRWWRALARR